MSSNTPRPTDRPTVEQLRADIDSGHTGDKIPVLDPAAAPMGTDDEAAGRPPDPEAIAKARAEELRRPSPAPHRHGLGAAWILIALILVIAIAVITWITLN